MGNGQNNISIVPANDIKCELWESFRKIVHHICVYVNCILRASANRQISYNYYPTDTSSKLMPAKICATSQWRDLFIIRTCNTRGYNCKIQNFIICTLIEEQVFTYLWEATNSSSFLAPFRFSAPNFTRKDLQWSRSSAWSPWKLQVEVDYMKVHIIIHK